MQINKSITRIFILLFFLFFFILLHAQSASVPFLERRISLTVVRQPTEKVLNQISEQVGCVFSYSGDLINSQNVSSITAANKPVKVVLNDIFGDRVSYKMHGKYIILKKSKEVSKPADTRVLEGYIYDKHTGRQVTEASVYDKNLGLSAITNQYGYFRIEVPQKELTSNLCVSKAGYSDTLLLSSTLNSSIKMMEVSLNKNTNKHELSSSFKKLLPRWLLPHKIDVHSTNLTDSLFRKVQLSLIPMVNSNALLTGNTKNDWSVNLTVGYVYAIQKCELGAGINIVRTNAGVCQLAGGGNIVGANSSGFQGAGGFNVARNSLGIQAAGGVNIARHNANIQMGGGANVAGKANVQLAGGMNVAMDTAVIQVSGGINQVKNYADLQTSGGLNIARSANVQVAGGVNIAKDTNIIQVSGALNKARETVVQIAGAANISQNTTLLQLAPVMNHASQWANIQIAAGINKAKTANFQLGLINVAKQSKKLQFGFVNIADSCSGIPIGFFSYVRSGYHHLEVSMDEASFASITFRTGVQHLYTSFSGGLLTKRLNDKIVNYSFGIGTSLGNPRKCLFDVELSSSQFLTPEKYLSDANQFKLYTGVDRKITRHISLAIGISYNMLITKTSSADDELLYSQIVPYTITDQVLNNGLRLRSWIGGKAAFRFR